MPPNVFNVTTNAVRTDILAHRLNLLSQNILAAPPASLPGAADTPELLKQSELLAQAKSDPVLASQLALIKAQAKLLKDAQAKQAEYQTAFASMFKDAAALLKR